jgi:hypothetical protein
MQEPAHLECGPGRESVRAVVLARHPQCAWERQHSIKYSVGGRAKCAEGTPLATRDS